ICSAVRVSVAIDPNGFPGAICLGSQCSSQPAQYQLPPGTYAVTVPGTVDAQGLTQSAGSVTISADGTMTTDAMLPVSFNRAGNTLQGRVAQVSLDFANYAGRLGFAEIGDWRGPNGAAVTLLIGRRYALLAPSSWALTHDDPSFSS